MSSLNKVQLIGRLRKDPELRTLPGGSAVVSFSLATSEKWKDKQTGEPREETEWHNIVIFGKLAEVCGKYLAKGSLVYLEGKNKTRKWEKDGVTRYTTEVVCDEMSMLGSKSEGGGQSQAQPQPQRQAAPAAGFDADIPF